VYDERMKNLVEEAYLKAVEYLLQNETEHGMAAARPSADLEKSTYSSLFSRDVGVCTLGMLASGNEKLVHMAKQSLANLTKSQSARGQFPQNYVVEKSEIHWWMPGTIDGSIWWSIGFLEYFKATGDRSFYDEYKANLDRAYTWLTYQDTNNDSLLEQGESAGWDDEMPRHGTVLYTNCLWYWLNDLRVEVEKRDDLKETRDRIKEGINTLLWVHKGDDTGSNYVPDNRYTREQVYAGTMIEWSNAQAVYLPYYLGYSAHREFEMRCDVFGNTLACLTGVADAKQAELFTDFIFRTGVNLPYPVKVLYPPIYPGEPDWKPYMAKGRQNYPWQYHNAGIWPFVGGFWVWWLARYDNALAEKELEKLAEAAAINDWEFNEYLHGQHGTPMGIAHQSWNMAMYIAAYHAVKGAK
jgi:glycogen debranching enzyme